jgi:hypothetical protein
MRTRLLPLLPLLIVLPGLALGEVYKWTDASGRIQFSDRPVQGAQPVPVPTKKTPPAESDKTQTPAPGQLGPYTQLDIVTPEPNATMRDAEGKVELGLLLEPAPMEGHRLQILLDGTPIPGQVPGTQILLTGVRIGSHQVQARILDLLDKVVATSAVINFHVRKPLPPEQQPKP